MILAWEARRLPTDGHYHQAHTARLTWNRSWSAATVTDFSAGFDRLHSLIVPEPNAVGPSVSFGAVLDPLGPGSDIPIDRVQNRFHYAGRMQQARGRHTWSAGGELGRRQINGDETSSQRGVIYFRNDFGGDAITNFRMGIPSRFSTGIGYSRRGFRNWESQVFAGDDWHAESRDQLRPPLSAGDRANRSQPSDQNPLRLRLP